VSLKLLVTDDEQGIRDALRQLLEYEGYQVVTATSGDEALERYAAERPHLVLLDVKMAGLDGLATLGRLRELDPGALVVMISGHGTIATAVEATQRGAHDFLEKPLDTDRVLLTIRNALKHVVLAQEVESLRTQVEERHAIVGSSAAIRQVIERIEKVAPTQARILITGENGTGKELVARAIHRLSPRKGKPFVEVNCAAIPSELIESELFGHVKGSFTGAFADRTGKFEQADGGTLFLDEVGDMSAAAQAKVLRALQEGIVTPIGSAKSVTVDVRVIAATNKRLEDEIAAGRFREDLLYRLNVVPVEVPPLRARRDDIPQLVEHFSRQLVAMQGLPPKRFAPAALERLKRHPWPGNIRELRNTVERLLILASGTADIGESEVNRLLGGQPGDSAQLGGTLLQSETYEAFKENAERAFLLAKLGEYDWNVSETARRLDMPRSNLYKKIERLGLKRES
jgi:two-component system nitrogen regulation response regulator NtrX